jgi:hypothetical protein
MTDSHEVRELRRQLRLAHKTQGKQGQTIAALRGELARVRGDHSKIERGDLRELERFREMAVEQFTLDETRLANAHEKIKALRDQLALQVAAQ